jgi:hypothetical protein
MRTRAALAAVALATLVLAGCEESRSAPAGPVGAPQVVCQGVPQAACRQAFDAISSNPGGAPRGTIVRVVMRCTLPVCTDANGESDITIFYVDGRQESSGYGWSSAPAIPVPEAPVPVITPPALAVQPDCQGVPLQQCHDMATSIDAEEMSRPIESITVRCNGVCTPESGQGKTIVHHLDGSADLTIDWVYGNGG